MIIRRNTKEFKTILEIVTACHDRPDRENLIRLYITKAGDSIRERINVEGIEGESNVFYNMGYDAVLGHLRSTNYQLYHSDEVPGIYFFRSGSNKTWDETPFEFDEAVAKQFSYLPSLPVVRKKEKAGKVVFPAPAVKVPSTERKDKTSASKVDKKKKPGAKSEAKTALQRTSQPDFKLKRDIHFTGLERLVSRQANLTKRDVLVYYDKIAERLLRYLKDRPQVIRLQNDGRQSIPSKTLQSLADQSPEDIPPWIQTAAVKQGREQALLLCNDREHLLLYAQIGCLEFNPCHSRTKSLDRPDYLIIAIESPEYVLGKAIDVAVAAKEILSGLKLPSFVKTDGLSGLQIYVPLDSESTFETSKDVAAYLCKLIRLKIPSLVVLKGSNDPDHGKVSLDYSLNEQGTGAIAPYSLVTGHATVATPLSWEEVQEGLRPEQFNLRSIFQRLEETGDPFEGLFKKKINADEVLDRLQANYSFLVECG